MGCGFGGWQGSEGLGHIVGEVVAFFGHLVAQVMVILTSGPALGVLTALVLILAAVALLKFILVRHTRQDRSARSQGALK